MDINPETLSVIGGGAGASGLLVWAFKNWVNRVNKRFDSVDERLDEIKEVFTEVRIDLAQKKASSDSKDDVMMVELRHLQEKNAILEKSLNKVWEIVQTMAPERLSDRLGKS